jgi:hypothetical protein
VKTRQFFRYWQNGEKFEFLLMPDDVHALISKIELFGIDYAFEYFTSKRDCQKIKLVVEYRTENGATIATKEYP